jgi:zinc transport system substrate-binding protein
MLLERPQLVTRSAAQIAITIDLIDFIKQNNIPVVLTIEMSNARVATAISDETGAGVAVMHSCHNRTADEYRDDVTYLDLMYKNAEVLAIALGCDENKGAETE